MRGFSIAIFGAALSCLSYSQQAAAQQPAPLVQPGTYAPLTPEAKVKRRALRLVEPVTLVSSAFGAGLNQWHDTPHPWGQGAEGFAKRFGSSEGFTAAHNTVALGFDLAMHTDPRYRSMPDGKFRARLWNAVSQVVIANKDEGGRTVNLAEIGGNYGAGFIANTWMPNGYNETGDALTRGTMGLALHAAKNVLREFLPDLKHKL